MTGAIPWSQLMKDAKENPAADYSPLPAGDYQTQISKVEVTKTQKAGETMFKMQAKVLTGPHTNRITFPNIIIPGPTAKPQRAGYFLNDLKACGISQVFLDQQPQVQQISDALLGKYVIVQLEDAMYNGEKRSNVKRLKPATSGAPSGAPSGPPPLPGAPSGPPVPQYGAPQPPQGQPQPVQYQPSQQPQPPIQQPQYQQPAPPQAPQAPQGIPQQYDPAAAMAGAGAPAQFQQPQQAPQYQQAPQQAPQQTQPEPQAPPAQAPQQYTPQPEQPQQPPAAPPQEQAPQQFQQPQAAPQGQPQFPPSPFGQQ